MALSGLGRGLLALILIGAVPPNARTQEFSSREFRVSGVDVDDPIGLVVREAAGLQARQIGSLAYDAQGILVGVCQNVGKSKWCMIRKGSLTGWVNARYLAPKQKHVTVTLDLPPAEHPQRGRLSESSREDTPQKIDFENAIIESLNNVGKIKPFHVGDGLYYITPEIYANTLNVSVNETDRYQNHIRHTYEIGLSKLRSAKSTDSGLTLMCNESGCVDEDYYFANDDGGHLTRERHRLNEVTFYTKGDDAFTRSAAAAINQALKGLSLLAECCQSR